MNSTKIKESKSRIRECITEAVEEAATNRDDRLTFAGEDSIIFAAMDVVVVRELPVMIDDVEHTYSMYYVGFSRYERFDGEMM